MKKRCVHFSSHEPPKVPVFCPASPHEEERASERAREGRKRGSSFFLFPLPSFRQARPPARAPDSDRARSRMSAGPYSGKSSLAAFARVGAVVGGLCYGVVVNGFTGIFGGK